MKTETKKSRLKVNPEAIVDALKHLCEPGQVIEVRALDAVLSNEWGSRPRIVSGFFNDLEQLAVVVAEDIKSATGIYVTINPVKPELLARACNRLGYAESDMLTKDEHVLRRCCLLIDVDPRRLPGISSTDAEHAKALALAKRISRTLHAEGWPWPHMRSDSGNGAHLLYRIKLPNDDAAQELIKRCLEALAARFDGGAAEVDQAVFNASRGWKLPGTPACKGDDVKERPHRLARMIHATKNPGAVSREQLEALAAMAPAPKAAAAAPRASAGRASFDLGAWVEQRKDLFTLRSPRPYGDGGHIWTFKACPWDASHGWGKAFLIQRAGGVIQAGCKHKSCGGKKWPDLRDVLEPGWREKRRLRCEAAGDAAPQGDVRLGDEFAAAYRDRVRYCPDIKTWLVWDGRRWEPDATHAAERLMQRLCVRRLKEAASSGGESAREKEMKFWGQAMRRPRVEAALWCARSNRRLVVRYDKLDSNPWLLNTLGGTLDLDTPRGGKEAAHLRKHDPADMITRLCPVTYDPDADQTEWMRFLDRVMPDEPMRKFLRRAAGYSITGLATEEVLFHISGPKNSGKSTFIRAVRAALGDYAASANFESFLVQHNKGGPRSDLVRLDGKRFVASVETEEGSRLACGVLKWLTGQDMLTVRTLYATEVEFLPTFTLWLVANILPRADDDDPALWRRLLLVPFTETIPLQERDTAVKQRLGDPAIGGPAVLAWSVKGCALWRHEGLQPPDAVRRATRQWRADNNPIADWTSERCKVDPNASETFARLRADYCEWTTKMVLKPISVKGLASRLRRLGCTVNPKDRSRTYGGIRII